MRLDQEARSVFLKEFVSAFVLAMRYFFKPKATLNYPFEKGPGSWKVVGSMAEMETSDVSHLTVSAGPGVKFVVSSPRKGTVTYVLPTDNMAGFEKALYQVKDFLSR